MSADTPSSGHPIERASRLRAMNERVRRMRDEFEGGTARLHAIMCECIDPACSEMLQMTADEFAAARVDEDCFIVLPIHVDGASTLIDDRGTHAIVRFG